MTPAKSSDQEVHCCIVGAGPAGAVLAYLLARRRMRVTLLEACDDFDRDFRGDTFHPLLMEIMEELGLAERVMALSVARIGQIVAETPEGSFTGVDFSRLRTRYPYITMIPQSRFLDFLTRECARFPTFEVRMGATVTDLLEDGGRVAGVRFREGATTRELRAALTVGADGRGSAVRRLGGFEQMELTPPMDVLWFRLPKERGAEQPGMRTILGDGAMMVLMDRGDQWQAAFVIRKGTYHEVREAGLEAFKRSVESTAPEFRGRLDHLDDWNQIAALSVRSSRVKRWYRPGLLLIGDAAHVMTPAGGVGINVAVQDAVVGANVLARPLETRSLRPRHLASVQYRRAFPLWAIQRYQKMIQTVVVSPSLEGSFRQPWFMQVPLLRSLPGRVIALGLWRVHVRV